MLGLTDLHDSGNGNEIDTKLNPIGLKPDPKFETEDKASFKVTKENTLITLVGTVTIQMVHLQEITASTSPPNRGRGSTDTDRAARNITVGFHEACHMADYQQFSTTNALPKFKGRVGDTKAVCEAAIDTFSTELNDYFGRTTAAFSTAHTNEVGHKKPERCRPGVENGQVGFGSRFDGTGARKAC